ncbi:MAG TPA: outer membrane lipoprotein-sorting protein [Bacteroidales bacterium]|nr:outer membrane lipoprotein-sorting protein [Bacteroidales bacterium]HRR16128.1 outer membrane lipoprotein-sorting protein [Bacteroidales bacterium]HRT47172.1 outer membrane lipoprotein-sorting protein [Bacteroidales bacterium]HRU56397.1 outer membrane lipoprotein-sorting protein [Bacteroidales bacterium]
MKKYLLLQGFLLWLISAAQVTAQGLSASEIVRKADEKFNGEKSSYSIMSMTIVRPTWQRTIEFKSWTLGRDYALTLITAPARDAGQSFLKRKNEMWNWNPSINRLIKLPPSMMSQGWMGSDYTNDDIMRESSVVNDYEHEFAGEEVINGRECYKIRMTAKKDASVIWGQQIRWIDKKDFLFLKAELYDEDGMLVRTETGSEIKMMDGRNIPTRIELIPSEEQGKKTIVTIKEIKFNIPVTEDFFSQQNMRTIR